MRAFKRSAIPVGLALMVMALHGAGAYAADAGSQTDYSNVAAVFQIGMGARPLAMGGAFVGLADDENAVFYNPAGLPYLGRLGLTSLYSTQYSVVTYGALGLATRGIGIAALYLDSPGISGAGQNSEILGDFAYTNLAALAGLGRDLGPLAIGARAKYLAITSARLNEAQGSSSLEKVTGNGFNIDLAAMVKLGSVRAGVLYENLFNTSVSYSTGASERWEHKLRAGVSASLGRVTLAADLENLGATPVYYHAGAEVALGMVALRGGATGPLGAAGDRELSAGAGLRLGNAQVDYAFLMPQTLPQTHRLSLTVRF